MTIHLYGEQGRRETFLRAWTEQLARLEGTVVLPEASPVYDGSPPSARLNLYFHHGGSCAIPSETLARHAWLPVVDTAAAAATLPVELSKWNAFRCDSVTPWAPSLVDDVLAAAWTPRGERRVFLSYRREDADGVAEQLHLRLSRLGYDVFVDRFAVHSGDVFQAEIYEAIYASDLIISLASPRLYKSTWARDEVDRARAAGVGVVIVRWPDFPGSVSPERAWTPEGDGWNRALTQSQFSSEATVALGDGDLVQGARPGEDVLSELAVERVLATARLARSRSIAGRLKDLLVTTERTLGRGKEVARSDVHPTDLRVAGETVRVLPFRPRPRELRRLHDDAGAGATCCYQENDPLHEEARAIRWLAESSPIQLVPYTGGLR